MGGVVSPLRGRCPIIYLLGPSLFRMVRSIIMEDGKLTSGLANKSSFGGFGGGGWQMIRGRGGANSTAEVHPSLK